jgi:hypothetical protein
VHAVVTALEGWLECVAVPWRVGTDPGMQPVGGGEGASEVAMAMRWGRRKVECVPGLRFPSCRSPFPRAVRSCLPVVVAFFFAPRPRRPSHLPLGADVTLGLGPHLQNLALACIPPRVPGDTDTMFAHLE